MTRMGLVGMMALALALWGCDSTTGSPDGGSTSDGIGSGDSSGADNGAGGSGGAGGAGGEGGAAGSAGAGGAGGSGGAGGAGGSGGVPDASPDEGGEDTASDEGGAPDEGPDVVASGCEGDDDCLWSPYMALVTGPEECYCRVCADTVLSSSEHAEREAAWMAHCEGYEESNPCPAYPCVEKPDPVCSGGVCEDLCALVDCAPPDCAPDKQYTPPGSCCPVCEEEPPPPQPCKVDGDCTGCAFPEVPASADECYCPTCPDAPLTFAECTANQEAFNKVCGEWLKEEACGKPFCPDLGVPACGEGGVCEFVEPSPYACETADDCAACTIGTLVESVDDCFCPGCPTNPMTVEECSTKSKAFQDICGAWAEEEGCVPPPCVPPEPLTCGAGGECQWDPCALVLCEAPDCPEEQWVTPKGECCPICGPPPGECSDDGECTHCSYEYGPKAVEDCYCPLCPVYPMSEAQCSANANSWNKVCGEWAAENPCPVAACIAPPEALCVDGECVSDPCALISCEVPACPEDQWITPPGECCPICAGEAECKEDADCTWCTFATAPETVDDCYCFFCPTEPMSAAECTANTDAWNEVCGKWYETAGCPVADCIDPGPVGCVDGVCGDPCGDVSCAEPACPEWEWIWEPGECCPTCPGGGGDSCESDGDCTWCIYDKPVTSTDECYCQLCGTPMLSSECAANAASYQKFCNGDLWPEGNECIPPPCPAPPGAVCDVAVGMCVIGFDEP